MNKNESVIQLLNSINKKINTTKKIKKKQRILISISGGQDSICLFFICIHLKKQWKWAFGIIYCNHLWQKNSFYSGSLILKLSYLFAIPMYYTISPNKIFKEKSARYWRYDFFYRLSFFYQYNFIYIGHTLNDAIETSLFQNIRSSNVKNLYLQNLKYFYSNNKFTKNNKIQTTFFYSLYLSNTYKKNFLKLFKKFFKNNFKKFFFTNYLNNFKFFFLKNNFKKYPNKQKNYILEKAKSLFFSRNKLKFVFNETQILVVQKSMRKKKQKNLSNFQVFLKLSSQDFSTIKTKITKKTFFSSERIIRQKLFPYRLIWLVRPILLLNRVDLKKLLLFFNLPIYPDTSNQKKIYSRNRIRKELLPTLKFFFNPQIEKNFFQFEKIKMAENFQLILLFKQFIKEFYVYNTKNIKLNFIFFFYLPIFIQQKLINQFLKNILGKQIQFINIQNLINLIKKTKNYNYNIVDYIYIVNYSKKHVKNKFKYKIKKKKTLFFLQVLGTNVGSVEKKYKKKFLKKKTYKKNQNFSKKRFYKTSNFFLLEKSYILLQQNCPKNIYTVFQPKVYFIDKKTTQISQISLFYFWFLNIVKNFYYLNNINNYTKNSRFIKKKLLSKKNISNIYVYKFNCKITNLQINYNLKFCILLLSRQHKNEKFIKNNGYQLLNFKNKIASKKILFAKPLKKIKEFHIVVNKFDTKIKKNIYTKNMNFLYINRFYFKNYH